MKNLSVTQILIILIHAFVLWALCGAIMGIGPTLMTMELTLIVHAIGAPVIAAIVSVVYFRFFSYTSPLQTAIIFTLFVMAVDAFIVAPFLVKSFEMFEGFIGTWLPFMLIFVSTYLMGLVMTGQRATIAKSG